MTNRPFRLRNRILACLILAWPHFAGAQLPAGAKQTASPATSTETLRQWIRDDNQLINGILTSLTHIDALVADIQRMVTALPDLGQTPQPVTSVAPIVAEKPAAPAEARPGPLGGWAPQLAGAGLLALLAFWLGRRRGMTQAPEITVYPEPEEKVPEPMMQRRVVPPPVFTVEEKVSLPQVTAPPLAPAPPTTINQSDQALELAEIMLSMGLGQGATQTLTEQIRNEPKQALRHWLKLLEIYRKNGQQGEFERSAEELRQHFNVKPEDWQAQPGEAKHSLEDYPHIARRLTELWGKPDCIVYMRNLLDDNRGGARAGFPQSVAEELLLLSAMLKAEGLVTETGEHALA